MRSRKSAGTTRRRYWSAIAPWSRNTPIAWLKKNRPHTERPLANRENACWQALAKGHGRAAFARLVARRAWPGVVLVASSNSGGRLCCKLLPAAREDAGRLMPDAGGGKGTARRRASQVGRPRWPPDDRCQGLRNAAKKAANSTWNAFARVVNCL